MPVKSNNEYGINVIDYRVLVKPHEKEAKTAGGLYIPDVTLDRQQTAMQRATVVDVSSQAFRDQDWRDEEWHELPVPGDIVLIERHAGAPIEGACGTKLRIIMATSVMAVIDTVAESFAIAQAAVKKAQREIEENKRLWAEKEAAYDEALISLGAVSKDDKDRFERAQDLVSTRSRQWDDVRKAGNQLRDAFTKAESECASALEALKARDQGNG